MAASRSLANILGVIAVAAVASIAASGAAHAQYGDVFGAFRPGQGDIPMIRERVQTLLDGPAEPRALEWLNPRTGNSGTVTFMRQVTRGSQQCRQIEYRMQARAGDNPEVAILLWCKQPSGRWAIVT